MKVKHVLGASATGAAALGLASAGYQAAGEARERRWRQPPGRLVDIGGRQLHIACAGEGSPAVVIIAALGASAASWEDVQRRLAQDTQVCAYDRAGLGWSDPGPWRRTGSRIAEELHALLGNAGVEPPYLLVGHSLGGLLARIFLRLYPDEVCGLALIDSSHPEQPWRLPRTALRNWPGGKLLALGIDRTRPLGLRRLARDLHLCNTDPGSSAHRRADGAELLAFDAICREVRELGDLGDLPLAVLTSAEIDPACGTRAQRSRSRFYKGWSVLQAELPRLSANSTHVVAERGGHDLNKQNPELVAEVIGALVRRVRQEGGSYWQSRAT